MNTYNRRQFLQSSALLMATAYAGFSLDIKKNKKLLSFSTLGCPDWTMDEIIDFAALHGYDGIEVRGIQREMDLTKCAPFGSDQKIQETLKKMRDKKLRFVNLGSSATMHFANPDVRKKNMEEGKRFIDLAQKLQCPYIRVFPNNFPKEQEKNATMDLIAQGLLELGDYAKTTDVKVLMETHGDLVYVDEIVKVMQAAANPNVGLVWDASNMWTITKEAPTMVYEKIKNYIHHTHIKDAKLVDDKIQYVFLGKGDVPIFEAIDALSKDGYKGYYSFEWEKLWHPEIADPALAIADYSKVMRERVRP